MNTSNFDYVLPPDLIAQHPPAQRDESRLMLLDRATKTIAHHTFRDLPTLLCAGDLLVLNDTKVLPARLFGKKIPTGGKVELLLLEEISTNRWRTLASASGKIARGLQISFDQRPAVRATITDLEHKGDDTTFIVAFTGCENIRDHLDQIGVPPLPPYIERSAAPTDLERYQTVFAKNAGAVAAPTAGLHFTPKIFDALDARGIEHTFLTLHVGLGTFRPVKTDRLEDHHMHEEKFTIPVETIASIHRAKTEHRRVVAVGTTVVRALESSSSSLSNPISDSTNIFIHPPYDFRITNALLTNFHLPRSTLLMLVSAFAGRDFVMNAYRAAIAERYGFYSYGDCMLIL